MGGLKCTVIKTSSPVTGPSPLVFSLGCLLIPFTTEFDAVKLGFTIVAVKARLPSALSRVAESISTSAGELVRFGTFPAGGNAGQKGKKGRIWIPRPLCWEGGAPDGVNP